MTCTKFDFFYGNLVSTCWCKNAWWVQICLNYYPSCPSNCKKIEHLKPRHSAHTWHRAWWWTAAACHACTLPTPSTSRWRCAMGTMSITLETAVKSISVSLPETYTAFPARSFAEQLSATQANISPRYLDFRYFQLFWPCAQPKRRRLLGFTANWCALFPKSNRHCVSRCRMPLAASSMIWPRKQAKKNTQK